MAVRTMYVTDTYQNEPTVHADGVRAFRRDHRGKHRPQSPPLASTNCEMHQRKGCDADADEAAAESMQ